jgi:uncharacterized protein YprB with RNaseH-like and TPR domain
LKNIESRERKRLNLPPLEDEVKTKKTRKTTKKAKAVKMSDEEKAALLRVETIEEVRRLLENKPIFLDTETTGFCGKSEIIEIAAVDVDGKVLLDTLVKPFSPVPEIVSQVHGVFFVFVLCVCCVRIQTKKLTLSI